MSGQVKKILQRGSLIVSLLFHLLLLLLFSMQFTFLFPKKIEIEKPPELYLPSYVYQEPLQPPSQPAPKPSDIPESKLGKETPIQAVNQSAKQEPPKEVAKKQAEQAVQKTQSIPKPKSTSADMAKSDVSEAVHLVGEKKEVQPLIEILGKALGARLQYPRIAIDFNLTGTSFVGFTLHPNGLVTSAHIVKSSGAGVLDDAALAGVKAMSPVLRVGPYVEKPRYMVVGIIFEGQRMR